MNKEDLIGTVAVGLGLICLGSLYIKYWPEKPSRKVDIEAVVKNVEDIVAGEDNKIDTAESQKFLSDSAIGYKRAIPQGHVVFFEVYPNSVRVGAGQYKQNSVILLDVEPEKLEKYIANHKPK